MSKDTMPTRQKILNAIFIVLIILLLLYIYLLKSEATKTSSVSSETQGSQTGLLQPQAQEEKLQEQTETAVRAEETQRPQAGQVLVNGALADVTPDGALEAPVVQLVPAESNIILYSGYENKLKLASIGVASEALRVAMKNGSVKARNGQYIVVPDKACREASITVSDGSNLLARYNYEVRELPTPYPYIAYTANGTQQAYKGNVPFSKEHLLHADGLMAQAAEGPDVAYKVTSFETIFIETGSEKVTRLKSQGNRFTDEQKRHIGQLKSGDKFHIISITVSGGEKTDEQIGSINVVLL